MACSTTNFFEAALDQAIPLSMQWDLTWRCDHKCVHCYLTDRHQDELSLTEGIQLLDQLAEAGTMMLLLSGGDLFLRRDALDLIKAARERAFDVKINTHGNHIDEALAIELGQLKLSQVSLSVYSTLASEHEAITLIPGSHQKTLNAAQLLIAQGLKVNFKTPLMEHNRYGWQGVGALAQRLGAKWELDAHISPDDQNDFGLCKIGIDPTEKMIALMNLMKPHREHAQALADMPKTPSTERTCSAGTVSGYISPDGRVFPCINWREEIGSIREHRFKELWFQHPTVLKQREIRRASYLQDCEGCAFHSHCNYCPGLSHAQTGDAARRSPFVCERTHTTMGAIEYIVRLNESQSDIPMPNSPEAEALFMSAPTYAQKQWFARQHQFTKAKDQLLPFSANSAPMLIQIQEPKKGC
jgi:radical SAM protein with 4Fe4S-binding SPASM domain